MDPVDRRNARAYGRAEDNEIAGRREAKAFCRCLRCMRRNFSLSLAFNRPLKMSCPGVLEPYFANYLGVSLEIVQCETLNVRAICPPARVGALHPLKVLEFSRACSRQYRSHRPREDRRTCDRYVGQARPAHFLAHGEVEGLKTLDADSPPAQMGPSSPNARCARQC